MSLVTLDSRSYDKESVVRGNHVYKTVWTPFIGESLVVNCEIENSHDSYAVTVYLEDFEFPCCSFLCLLLSNFNSLKTVS